MAYPHAVAFKYARLDGQKGASARNTSKLTRSIVETTTAAAAAAAGLSVETTATPGPSVGASGDRFKRRAHVEP